MIPHFAGQGRFRLPSTGFSCCPFLPVSSCDTEGHPGIIDAIAAHDLDDYDTDKYDDDFTVTCAITFCWRTAAEDARDDLGAPFPRKGSGRALHIRSGGDTDFADLVQYFHGGGVFSVAMCAAMKFSRLLLSRVGISLFGTAGK